MSTATVAPELTPPVAGGRVVRIVPGVVRNGVVEFAPGLAPPDGTAVEVFAPHLVRESKPTHGFRDADGVLLDLSAEEIELFEGHNRCVAHSNQLLFEMEKELASEEGAGHAAG